MSYCVHISTATTTATTTSVATAAAAAATIAGSICRATGWAIHVTHTAPGER